jgi:hypothetical protein
MFLIICHAPNPTNPIVWFKAQWQYNGKSIVWPFAHDSITILHHFDQAAWVISLLITVALCLALISKNARVGNLTMSAGFGAHQDSDVEALLLPVGTKHLSTFKCRTPWTQSQ